MEQPLDYDALDPEEQKLVRARWPSRFAAQIAELDLVAEFEEQGVAYAELDENGEVVVRYPGGSDAQ